MVCILLKKRTRAMKLLKYYLLIIQNVKTDLGDQLTLTSRPNGMEKEFAQTCWIRSMLSTIWVLYQSDEIQSRE